MKDIRLVALDLDGTVFNDKKEITPRTLAAIRAACARGVAVLPATGRTASGIPAAFTSIPGVRYALTSNGASVVDLTTGEKLVNQPFGTEQALKIYDLLEQGGGMMSISSAAKLHDPRKCETTWTCAETCKDYIPHDPPLRLGDEHARDAAHPRARNRKVQHDLPRRGRARRRLACHRGRLPRRGADVQPAPQHGGQRPPA